MMFIAECSFPRDALSLRISGSIVFSYLRGRLIQICTCSGMSLDESIYSSPSSFFPERYLPQPVGRAEPQFGSVYGFGRRFTLRARLIYGLTDAVSRVCTGQHLGDQSLWIAIASILASCNISNAYDKHGNVIVPEASMSDGVSRCAFVVRIQFIYV